jgi:hypothetical protein
MQTPAGSASSGTGAATASADKAAPLTGAWTLNKDQSDQPQSAAPARDDGAAVPRGGGRRGGGRGGGFGGGGFGGGRGAGGGRVAVDPQEAARMREAMRDVLNPPDHLTIVSTGTMVLLTGADGRTTRLSPDGKKIKDESTSIERKTKWDGANLVSEISGLNGGKVTETYSLDADHHQFHIAAVIEGVRGGQPRTISHVYDQDAR